MKAIAALFIAILLLSGCTQNGKTNTPFGLRTIKDCQDPDKYSTTSLQMKCYHSAAMTSAYMGDLNTPETGALDICASIWNTFGGSGTDLDPNSINDMQKVAAVEADSCYYDVAEIARDPSVCDKIGAHISDTSIQLFGDTVNQENCNAMATRLHTLDNDVYHNNPNSICNMIFILPLILLGAWKYRR